MSYHYSTMNWMLPKTNSRNEMRKFVVLKFMEERPGQGTGSLVTRHKYIVEDFSDGRHLYLLRPASNKFGFDFQVWIENWNNLKKDKMPSHKDIIQDLKLKAQKNDNYLKILLNGINKIFICEDDDRVLNWLKKKKVSFMYGESIEVLLKTIKWMFIEQDIRILAAD